MSHQRRSVCLDLSRLDRALLPVLLDQHILPNPKHFAIGASWSLQWIDDHGDLGARACATSQRHPVGIEMRLEIRVHQRNCASGHMSTVPVNHTSPDNYMLSPTAVLEHMSTVRTVMGIFVPEHVSCEATVQHDLTGLTIYARQPGLCSIEIKFD
jgi:hypothetical protein